MIQALKNLRYLNMEQIEFILKIEKVYEILKKKINKRIKKINFKQIILKKGWIKYALQEGYTVYPVYNFNENKTY